MCIYKQEAHQPMTCVRGRDVKWLVVVGAVIISCCHARARLALSTWRMRKLKIREERLNWIHNIEMGLFFFDIELVTAITHQKFYFIEADFNSRVI